MDGTFNWVEEIDVLHFLHDGHGGVKLTRDPDNTRCCQNNSMREECDGRWTYDDMFVGV